MNRNIRGTALHLVLWLCIRLALTSPPPGDWSLVLEDHFNTFNHNLWTKGWTWCNPLGCPPPLKEKPGDTCYFPDEAVYIEDGKLVLESKRQEMGGYHFTSGVVNSAAYNSTQGFPCLFGYYETSFKSSPGGWEGFCPAFWFPNTVCPVGQTCELDIEIPGGNCCSNGAEVWFSVHGNDVEVGSKMNCTTEKGYCGDDYHVYGLLWQSDMVCFYYDGVEGYCTKEKADIPQTTGWMVFDNEMGLGGDQWAGFPNDKTPFPQKMYIDWVRVWKPKSLLEGQ